MGYQLEYVIDISGTFPSDTYLGMCTVKTSEKNELWNDFRNRFPKVAKGRIKGKDMDSYELYQVAEFLDGRGVHMTVLPLDSSYLEKVKDEIGDGYNYVEKTIGAAYFTIVAFKAKQGHSIDVTVDHDNWMDVAYAIKKAKELGDANNYYLNLYTTRNTHHDFIKISDCIAQMKRSLRGENLDTIDLPEIMQGKIKPGHLGWLVK